MITLLKRILTGIIYVLLVIAGLTIHPISFAFIFLLFGILSLDEFGRLFKQSIQNRVIGSVMFVASFGIVFLASSNIFAQNAIPILAIFITILFLFHLFSSDETAVNSLGKNALGYLYIVVPFLLAILLVFNSGTYSGLRLLLVFIIIWVNDSMAYSVGMLMGKHALFKRISPKKSWEGFFGGIIFSGVSGFLIHYWVDEKTTAFWIAFGIIIALFASLGDLFESLIKRHCNTKDSGRILPGHGGMLDRLDSVFFAIPAAYILFEYF